MSDKLKASEHGWVDIVDTRYGADADSAPQWASSAAVYEWSGDEGEVGPADPRLEQDLFHGENEQRAGAAFDALQLQVDVQGPVKIDPVTKVSRPRFSCSQSTIV